MALGYFRKPPGEGTRRSFLWEGGVRVERRSGNEEQGQKDTVEMGAAQGLAGVRSFRGTPVGVLLLETSRES